MKFKIGDKEFDLDKEVADAINAEFKSRDDAFEAFKKKAAKEKGDAADVEAAIEKATKELKSQADKLQAKCDSLEEKLAAKKDGASAAEVSKLVKERARVEKVAATVLGAEAAAKLDDKSDLDVMKEVIVKASPKTDLKDKSEDYIRARFDSIAEENEGREERRNQFSIKTDSRKEEEFDSTAARKRNIDSDKDLWQKPLATSKK